MGGRVHWLLLFLPRNFTRVYTLQFDYEYHNYHFVRYDARTPIDEYIIIRTSRNCFRCMYFNYKTTYFDYFSEQTAKHTADHIEQLFEKILMSERRRGDR